MFLYPLAKQLPTQKMYFPECFLAWMGEINHAEERFKRTLANKLLLKGEHIEAISL